MRKLLAFVLFTSLAIPVLVAAHEGHDHRFLGTVKLVDIGKTPRIEIRTRDDKTKTEKVVSVVLSERTRYFRGNTLTSTPDIQLNERIVVTATGGGKQPYTAKEIRLAER